MPSTSATRWLENQSLLSQAAMAWYNLWEARDSAMKRRAGNRRSAGEWSATDKLLSLPGIKEAMELVKEHASFFAMDETLDAAARGELGGDLRELLNDNWDEVLDKFFENESVHCEIAEREDELLEELAVKAGPKIAELWELSEPAGEELAAIIYWGRHPKLHGEQPYWLPFVLVVSGRPPDAATALHSKCTEFLLGKAVVMHPEAIRDGHIYLDVTYLPYRALSLAYGAVLCCRTQLGIEKQDLREGAPRSIDVKKALKAAELKRSKGSKEAAKELGFRIYRSDNRSGSYPLFRKYAELGHVLGQRLDALDTFLFSLEDNLRRT